MPKYTRFNFAQDRQYNRRIGRSLGILSMSHRDLYANLNVDVLVVGCDALINGIVARTLSDNGMSVLIHPTFPTDIGKSYSNLCIERFEMKSPLLSKYVESQSRMTINDILCFTDFPPGKPNETVKQPAILATKDSYILSYDSYSSNSTSNTYWCDPGQEQRISYPSLDKLMSSITLLNSVDRGISKYGMSSRSTPRLSVNASVVVLTSCTSQYFNDDSNSKTILLSEAAKPMHSFSLFTDHHRMIDIMSAYSCMDLISNDSPNKLIKTYYEQPHESK